MRDVRLDLEMYVPSLKKGEHISCNKVKIFTDMFRCHLSLQPQVTPVKRMDQPSF